MRKIYFHIQNWVKKFLKFGDIETPIFSKDIDTEKVLVSNEIYFGEENYRYFIGYLDNDHKVKSLHTMLHKTSAANADIKKLVLIPKKNLITTLSIINIF